MFQSLGFSVDWDLQYETASPETQLLSQKLFWSWPAKERLTAGKRPCSGAPNAVPPSPRQSWIPGKPLRSFIHCPFSCGETVLPVATTRPELLFGCVCLFIHPENPNTGNLLGRQQPCPFYGFEIPILADEKADPEKGTGIVMCATFGDSTDAQWVLEHGLPTRGVLQKDGRMGEDVPYLSGLRVKQARKEIIRLLEEADFFSAEPVIHTVAVHERCGTEVEILPSRQWYIDVLSQRSGTVRRLTKLCGIPRR